METKRISPIGHPLNAAVRMPGSKSITNRALLIASLASGTTHLSNALFSDDSRYFAEALQKLGFEISLDPLRSEMKVRGLGGQIPSRRAELYVGNAGTAARFLTAFLTLGSGEYVLDGDSRMRQRPIGDLIRALEQLGASLQGINPETSTVDKKSICPPVRVSASGLTGGTARVAGDISSQFLSAVLMVTPYAQTSVDLAVDSDLHSKPYVDLTLEVMSDFGVDVHREGYLRFLIHSARYQPRETYAIESDATAASYFFAAPAILGGTVRVENLSRSSKQGDIAFLDVLGQMGCTITEGSNYLEVTGASRLRGVDVFMGDIPDTAQTLAAIAPFACTPTRMRGIASARVKETDRIAATGAELKRLGVQVEEYPDGLTIYPCSSIRPAAVQTYSDHRMAMSFSLIGLRVPGITIENPACVSKTFPNYFEELEKLR
jgi:3-phosphoshikimate 1-carboxyvinyltransferase